jgi:hypothetical protein
MMKDVAGLKYYLFVTRGHSHPRAIRLVTSNVLKIDSYYFVRLQTDA